MLERVLHFSIHHRLLVILLTVGAALVGVESLLRLPIDAVPDITNNQVQINTVFPAFSPPEVEKQITFPVETALSGIPGLSYTRSLSRNGFSQVTAVFDDAVDIYFARQQVNERLSEARAALPPGADPKMGPISTGLGEIYMWVVEYAEVDQRSVAPEVGPQSDGSYRTPEGRTLRSPLEKAAYLRELQDWVIRPQLKTVTGVAGVDAIGGYLKHYVVQPDPAKLVAFGVSLDDILTALERNSQSTGAGYIEQRGESYVVRSSGLLRNEEEIGGVVVQERKGIPVRVRDVGDVVLGSELRTGSASENGEEVVVGTALMLIGENSRTVAKAVDAKLAQVNKSLPFGVRAKPVLNRTKLVDATIKTVERNLTEGAILVIVVLFALLGNIRAALITALAIPLSMFLTAIGMVQGRVSGNLMSLGAIDFGLIVDGAVIIVENCVRRLAERQHELGRTLTLAERLDTVYEASREVRGATAFGEAIIITVYIPILFLTGVEGKMFQPMAITVILALCGAFVLSLTFIPAMVALGLSGKITEKENFFIRVLKRGYEPALRVSLRASWAVVAVATVAFLGSLLLFRTLGQEFVPTLDEKDIALHALRMPRTGLTQSQDMQFAVERAVSRQPEVAFVFSKTGTAELAADPMPPNVSDTFIILKPQAEWPTPDLPKADLVKRIQAEVEKLPGNNYEFTQPIQMRFNELIAGVRSDVAVKLFGDDYESMLPVAQQIYTLLRKVPGANDVRVEQVSGLPMLDVAVKRQEASRLGLDVRDVQDVVATAVGGREAGFVFEGDRRFNLLVRLPETLRADLEQLKRLPVPLSKSEQSDEDGALALGDHPPGFVPLESVAELSLVDGPNQISRENGKRRIVIQANVRGRDLGSFVAEAQAAIDTQVKLPSGYWMTWGGQFENLTAAKKRLTIVVPVCFFMIFLLLFSTFGSVRQAFMVFSAVPLALSGGIVSLWACGLPFSISAAVGFIALSGVAVLNGLVMVSFINGLVAQGVRRDVAIVNGSLTRLRPVMMTAVVAALGFVPMALATGTGAEVQRPLAIVVIGGIVTSTALTLFVLPALYRLIMKDKQATPSEEVPA
ncbi:CusA/CzcA family heavy metal efflux RND transporter [bacterium]|nr:CusA/CzcA family heavy metal efflux RND transporter [bacterium]